VRFTLTAGQKGDAPQAAALLEGLPAEVVMADTAYDADHFGRTEGLCNRQFRSCSMLLKLEAIM
jgi:hypothetical protein